MLKFTYDKLSWFAESKANFFMWIISIDMTDKTASFVVNKGQASFPTLKEAFEYCEKQEIKLAPLVFKFYQTNGSYWVSYTSEKSFYIIIVISDGTFRAGLNTEGTTKESSLKFNTLKEAIEWCTNHFKMI